MQFRTLNEKHSEIQLQSTVLHFSFFKKLSFVAFGNETNFVVKDEWRHYSTSSAVFCCYFFSLFRIGAITGTTLLGNILWICI